MSRERGAPFERHRSHATVGASPGTGRHRTRLLGWLVAGLLVAGVVYAAVLRAADDPAVAGTDGLVIMPAPVELHHGPLRPEPLLPLSVGGGMPSGGVVVELSATATGAAGTVTIASGCDSGDEGMRFDVGPATGVTKQLVVAGVDAACLTGSGPVEVVVDAIAILSGDARVQRGIHPVTVDVVSSWASGDEQRSPAAGVEVLDAPIVVADSRPGALTFDGEYAATGLRPAASTWQVPLARARGGASAALVRLSGEGSTPGHVVAHAPTAVSSRHQTLRLSGGGDVSTTTAIVPLDRSGRLCASTTAPTHLVVEVLAWFDSPSPTGSTDDSAPDCPAQKLFPHWRMVAMYGTDRSARLGVLGEQDPETAASRLEEIAAPWRAGDRPVLPAFELIATIATADRGRDGMHRLVSSPEFVQRYLDVARRHGFYLILDIQPGYASFLEEAKRYETFLREPDVGLALDPEWKVSPPRIPGGGSVGTVDAAEVNAVSEWLSTLVAEENLPEKLLVIHQFQPRMLTRRDMLVEPEGVAVVVHMDGFGTRAAKQDTYSKVKVTAPWDNGLKLFYDEDVDMYQPADVLAGVFEPMPVLITYQ